MTTPTSEQRQSLNASVKKLGSRIKRGLATGGVLFSFAHPTPPVPASRPRVSKFGTYYGKTYNRFRVQGKADLDEQIKSNKIEPVPPGVPIALVLESVVEPPKAGKKLWPKGDVDNHSKSLLDLGNPEPKINRFGLWADDDQIVALTQTKRYAEADEQPGTVFTCYRLPGLG